MTEKKREKESKRGSEIMRSKRGAFLKSAQYIIYNERFSPLNLNVNITTKINDTHLIARKKNFRTQ